jgi:hypothetical protein
MLNLLLEASTLNLDQASGYPDRFLVLFGLYEWSLAQELQIGHDHFIPKPLQLNQDNRKLVGFAMVLLDNPLNKVRGVLKRTICSGR